MASTPIDALRHLSATERIQLAQDLWDSVLVEADRLPLIPKHREELERRLSALDADGELGEPWDIVRERLLKSL
jgi:putative addiction module component (TIGR02574 family)